MKLLAVSLVSLFMFSQAQAGKMKEIWYQTNEAVLEVFGFDESMISISGHKFVTVEGADVAIQTTVRGPNGKEFTCVTLFKEGNEFYKAISTKCSK